MEAHEEDLNRHLKSRESFCEAAEVAMQRLDAEDWDWDEFRDAFFSCLNYRRDALKKAIANRDFMEIGKCVENVLYEYLVDREVDRE